MSDRQQPFDDWWTSLTDAERLDYIRNIGMAPSHYNTAGAWAADKIERLLTLFARHLKGHEAMGEWCGICWKALTDE